MESFQHALGYPECKNTKPIVESIKEPCPKCGGQILVKKSKKGRKFYVCENNQSQKCDYISWNKPKAEAKKTEKKENQQDTTFILQLCYKSFTFTLQLTKIY